MICGPDYLRKNQISIPGSGCRMMGVNSDSGGHRIGESLMIFSKTFWTFVDKKYFKTSRG